jgi:sugar phosphate isomerase/epimerase
MNRRTSLQLAAGSLAMGLTSSVTNNITLAADSTTPQDKNLDSTFAEAAKSISFCLNTSTIHGENIPVTEQIKIASKAGYTGIELWVRDVDKYVAAGNKLSVLRRQIADAGLQVQSAIAFGEWIVDDEAARKKGLVQCGKDMEIIRELGGRRIAAPPTGATKQAGLDLDRAGERYRELIEVGRARDVVPQLEVWGFSKNLHRLSQVLYVCAAAQHPDACILPDIYHLFKGGSDFSDTHLLPGSRVHVLHMNDYPADPPRETISDQHRVYPGDGVAPIRYALQAMMRNGFAGVLSLELFNRDYWNQDPNIVAATGLAKMKASVADAIA